MFNSCMYRYYFLGIFMYYIFLYVCKLKSGDGFVLNICYKNYSNGSVFKYEII